jgi:hypothetical protein
MTRVVSVGRSQGLFVACTLGLALLVSVTGCPGALENPDSFPPPVTGAAGTGPTGAAGTGAAGTGAAGTTCDITPLFVGATSTYKCTLAGSCHDAMGSAAKLDMVTAGWENTLVGKTPPGGGTIPSECMAAGKPYLEKGSNPAKGLFIDKLTTPTCGMQMPELTGPITAPDMACIMKWATSLTTKP